MPSVIAESGRTSICPSGHTICGAFTTIPASRTVTRPASTASCMSEAYSNAFWFWPGLHVISTILLRALYSACAGVCSKTSLWYP